MKTVELSNATLEAISSDHLELDWTPDKLSYTGFTLDSVSLQVSSTGVLLKASGTLSMDISNIVCAVSAAWQKGLGAGSFHCDLVLNGDIALTIQSSTVTVTISKLNTSVFGNAISLSDISFTVDKDDLGNLTSSVKTELEKGETGLFNKFWASQVINGEQVLSDKLKDKTVSLHFKSLSLDVSNDIVAIAGGQTLTFERSTISGSLSCTWTYSGVALSLKASMTFMGKKETAITAISNAETDLGKLSRWVAGNGSQLYDIPSKEPELTKWIRGIGSFLRSKKIEVAKTFEEQKYSGSIASQAVDGAYQSGAGKVLSELYLAGYDTNALLDAMRYGMHLAPTQFASTFKNTLHWGYRTVGIRMKDVGFSAIEIADGLNQSIFACTTTDIAKLFQHPEYGYKADDFDGASGHLFDVIKSHLDKGKSKGGGGFFKGPPGPGKPG